MNQRSNSSRDSIRRHQEQIAAGQVGTAAAVAKLQDELQAVKGQLADAKQDVQVQTHLCDQAEKQYLAERLVKADKAYNRFRREHKARLNAV